MQSYTVHLIRHGLCEGNLLGQYIGSTDSPLAPQGEEQLRALRQQYEYPRAQAYYSSPLRRCVQTMSILYPEANVTLIDDFRECDFGDWEGKTAQELSREDPDFEQWMENGAQAAPKNGESGVRMMARVCAAFERLVETMMRTGVTSVVLVAHGGTLMSILSAYGLPRAKFYDWMTDCGCGYSLRITPGLWMRSMVAEVYDTIPPRGEPREENNVINLAREAADRAFGGDGEAE